LRSCCLIVRNQTEKVFAQLKFKNITEKTIKAVKVKLFPLDTIGNAIEGVVEHEYLDLSAVRDEEFGQKTAVIFPNASTRGFSVEVTAVYFADNSAWSGSGSKWEALPQPETLESALGDKELVKQYRIKYGADCKFAVYEHLDLWRCSCGAWNRNGEKCHVCGMELWFLKAADLEELKADRDARLEAQRQKAAADKATANAQAKKAKKRAMIIVPIVAVLIAAAVIIAGVVKKNQEEVARLEAYNAAVELLNNAQYTEAIAAFTALGDYKDSAEQIVIAEELAEKEEEYIRAVELLSSSNYLEHNKAYEILGELGDYKDSLELRSHFFYLPIKRTISDVQSENSWDVREGMHYTYDAQGRLVMIKSGNPGTETSWKYVYNDDGTYTKTYYANETEIQNTEYNSHGDIIREYNDRGQNEYTTYEYYENGMYKRVEHTAPNSTHKWLNWVREFDEYGNFKHEGVTVYGDPNEYTGKIDEHNNVIYSNADEGRYQYNESGYVVRYEYWYEGKMLSTTEWEYDESGVPVKGRLNHQVTTYQYEYAFIYCPDCNSPVIPDYALSTGFGTLNNLSEFKRNYYIVK